MITSRRGENIETRVTVKSSVLFALLSWQMHLLYIEGTCTVAMVDTLRQSNVVIEHPPFTGDSPI